MALDPDGDIEVSQIGNLVITFPNRSSKGGYGGKIWTAPVSVKSLKYNAPIEEKMTVEAVFKITGPVVRS